MTHSTNTGAAGNDLDVDCDSGIPPGWSANPSTWPQRTPIIVLAVFGGLAAIWLALHQQGIVSTVWEPFFGTHIDASFGGGWRSVFPSQWKRLPPPAREFPHVSQGRH